MQNGQQETPYMPFTRRTLAADVKTLDANSNFPLSEHKVIRKGRDDEGHTDVIQGCGSCSWERETRYLLR